jgi:L-alanine-DL-glutamate epimerase-like enolase superfamily enzyme
VAITTDAVRAGKRVVGYGFSSVGRFGQSGLIRERFAPRLLAAQPQSLTISDREGLDPFACWSVMMSGEKLGGHGERCVAVGTLDMAIWDAAAKLASMPLEQFITERLGRKRASAPRAFVYAGGGYLYPDRDIACLTEEIRRFLDLGFSHAKIKIGAAALGTDIKRVEAAARLLPGGKHLAVTQ